VRASLSKTLLLSTGLVAQAPSIGLSKELAPPSTSSLESSPAHLAVRFGLELPHSRLGPPSWFLPTLTVSSSMDFAGLLHPAADPGVHRVSASATRLATRLVRFPDGASTLQSFPLPSSRSCVTAGRFPLAVAGLPPGRPRGLPPLVSPLHLPSVAGRAMPDALLGFPYLER
jgi:hypothetical protein